MTSNECCDKVYTKRVLIMVLLHVTCRYFTLSRHASVPKPSCQHIFVATSAFGCTNYALPRRHQQIRKSNTAEQLTKENTRGKRRGGGGWNKTESVNHLCCTSDGHCTVCLISQFILPLNDVSVLLSCKGFRLWFNKSSVHKIEYLLFKQLWVPSSTIITNIISF